jgi:nitrogen fixation NifU-like protein
VPVAFEEKLQDAIANPQNMGEMADADAVGTVGSADCGDMVRMFLKFSEKDGKKVIDKASFQSFGCQTAIAVASMATEMLKGKSLEEAGDLSADEMSSGLGALPPMKVHCGQMVEGALRSALEGGSASDEDSSPQPVADPGALAGSLSSNAKISGKIKIIPLGETNNES